MQVKVIVVTVGLVCLVTRTARANECNAYVPITAAQIPAGCPFEVHIVADRVPIEPLKVLAFRGGPGHETSVDVTGAIQRTTTHHPFTFDEPDAACQESFSTVDTLFDVFVIDIAGAQQGDRVQLENYAVSGPTVVAAGPCTALDSPTLYCSATTGEFADCLNMLQPHGDDPGGGCAATVPSGALAPLTVLSAMILLRSRRRRMPRTGLRGRPPTWP